MSICSSTIFTQTKFVSSIYTADVMQVSGVLTFSKELVSFDFDYFSNKEMQYNSSSEITALKVILFKELRTLKTCDENDGHSDPCASHHLVRKYLIFDYLISFDNCLGEI